MSEQHDFTSKIIGYKKPSEPQWVQDVVRCYMPPIREYTCQKCGFSYSNDSAVFFLTMTEETLPPCVPK